MGWASHPLLPGAPGRLSVFGRWAAGSPVAAVQKSRHPMSIPSVPEGFMKTATRKAALLVIDVQESFRKRPYWQPQDAGGFLANKQELIDNSRQKAIPE